MLGLGLRLLGIGKFIREFLAKHWKLVLVVLAIAFVAYTSYKWYSNKIDEAYKAGQQSVRDEYQRKVDEANKKNEATSKLLEEFTDSLDERINKRLAAGQRRTANEINNMEKIIINSEKYKTCVVDPEIVSARNKIREQGPQ